MQILSLLTEDFNQQTTPEDMFRYLMEQFNSWKNYLESIRGTDKYQDSVKVYKQYNRRAAELYHQYQQHKQVDTHELRQLISVITQNIDQLG